MEDLKDGDAQVRRAAVMRLEEILIDAQSRNSNKFGPESMVRSSIQALREAMDDDDWFVRVQAAGVLGSIDGSDNRPLSVLIEALKSDDAWEVAIAANRISFLGLTGKAAVPELVKALQHSDSNVRINAAQALREIGEHQAIPSLIVALEDTNESVAEISAQALCKLGPAAQDAVPTLIKALKRGGRLPVSAARALGKIGGPGAKGAVPELVSLFQRSNDLEEKMFVAQSLGEIGPAAETAVPAFVAVLKHDQTDVILKTTIIQALGRIGPKASDAEGALESIAKENDVMTQDFAIHALRRIRSASR
jgi:HEAT repeat protein